MTRAAFTRPDGRSGSYRDWLAETAARWQALSLAEQTASRDAAIARLAARIQAQADGTASLHLYDEIGYFGVWPADVVAALSDIRGDVEVHLNSPGGSVFDGLTIYSTLKEHPGQVSVVVDGLAASAASFIAMAAAPGHLEMQPNGTMMIHEAWGGCVGSEADMRATADVLAQQTANIANIYAERGGRTVAEYRELMAAETWMVGQEAVDLGLADRVRDAKAGGGAAALPVAASAPWSVTILASKAAPAKADEEHGSFDGGHTHAHPSYGALGEDGPYHTHAHVHENDSNHNHDHEPDGDEMARSGHGVRNADGWDGPAAMSRAAKADDPAAAFRAICAGEKTTGEPDQEQHWALPHHDNPGDPANPKGVSSALGYLDRTQDLKSKSAARAHLEAHERGEGHGTDNRAELPAWLAKALTAKEAN